MTNDLTPTERSFARHLQGAEPGFWGLQWKALEAADEDTLAAFAVIFPEPVAILSWYRTLPNFRAKIARFLKERDANG